MRCKGRIKRGSQCRKTVLIDSDYCAQHESQEPVEETFPCVRCGPEKQTSYRVVIETLPEGRPSLCRSCAVELQRINLEFIGIDDIDERLLEFREGL